MLLFVSHHRKRCISYLLLNGRHHLFFLLKMVLLRFQPISEFSPLYSSSIMPFLSLVTGTAQAVLPPNDCVSSLPLPRPQVWPPFYTGNYLPKLFPVLPVQLEITRNQSLIIPLIHSIAAFLLVPLYKF